jgi:outer membrane beta-barrel protein
MKLSTWILPTLLLASLTLKVAADEIEVPEEELSRDTVLPVFSKRRIVLNRSVVNEQRFEFGGGVGLELNEPYYSSAMFNVEGTYNFTETSAFNVQGLFWTPGLSSYGVQLQAGSSKFEPFDPSKAPHPVWAFIGNYEFIAYYGKISVSKQFVMNLNLFALGGLGYINMGSIGEPAANLGIGQDFFVTHNIGIRYDLRLLIFQGPNATTVNLDPKVTPGTPSPSAFGNRIYYNTQLDVMAVFLL